MKSTAFILCLLPLAACATDEGANDTSGLHAAEATCPDPSDPGVSYLSNVPNACELADVACPDGWDVFNDECGCGCIQADDGPTCEPASPTRYYVANSPEMCSVIDYACEDGWEGFESACGCGCVQIDEPDCCEPESDTLHYVGHGADECVDIDFDCPAGWEGFDNDCGCGCKAPEAACCAADEQPGVGCFDQDSEADCQAVLGCVWQPTNDGGACFPGADEGYLCCADGTWHPNWPDGDPAACDPFGGTAPVCEAPQA